MKRMVFIALVIVMILDSCSHGLTPSQAASAKQKCGRSYVK